MKKIVLNLHSVIDVITNSSTEIFSIATSHGLDNIKNLITTIIETFDPSVKYEDVIKKLYIEPTDTEKLYGIYAMYIMDEYIKDVPKEVIELLESICEDTPMCDYDENEVYEFFEYTSNIEAFESAFGGELKMEKYLDLSADSELAKYMQDKLDDGGYREYPVCTDFVIIANDKKYSKLVQHIENVMKGCYNEEAHYC